MFITTLLASSFLSGAGADYVSSQDFVTRYQAAAIADSKYLYIDSGTENVYLQGQTDLVSRALPYTLSIPLSDSWVNSSVTIGMIPKPSDMVIWSNTALWMGPNNSIIQFGGEKVDVYLIPSPDPPLSVWSMTPTANGNGTWKEIIHPSDLLWDNLTRPNAGLHAQNTNLHAFYLGGHVSNWTAPTFDNTSYTAPLPLSGLVKYDPVQGYWSNISSAGYSEYGNGVRGGMAATTMFGGSQGVLIMMGGDIGGRSSRYVQVTALRSMDNITVYDITNNKWYHQTATGDIPPPRIDMCVVGLSEPQSGTYEIFMTGGFNGYYGPDNSDYNVVYVLTLPAFHWMQVAITPPRAAHSCVVARNTSQMIVVGGFDPTQPTLNASAQIPDPFAQGLGVFNMTSMTWQDHYDGSAAPYKSSVQIRHWYNSTTPNLPPSFAVPATYTPQNGWTQPGLQAVMQQNSNAQPASAFSTPSPSPLPANNSTKSHTTLSPGALTGIILGALAAFALIILFVLLLLRRRRHQHLPALTHESGATERQEPKELPCSTNEAELPCPTDEAELPGSLPVYRYRSTDDNGRTIETGMSPSPLIVESGSIKKKGMTYNGAQEGASVSASTAASVTSSHSQGADVTF